MSIEMKLFFVFIISGTLVSCEVEETRENMRATVRSVVEYSDTNFKTSVEKGPHFIMFFAPWCGHSRKLAPTWEDLANIVNAEWPKEATIARVDCTLYNRLCYDQGVSGYPTLKFFKSGAEKEDGVKYVGMKKNVESMRKFIKDQLAVKVVNTRGMNNTLDDILSEMSSMRSDMDTKLSEIQSDMDRMDKLIHQVEEVRDLHFLPQTMTPTLPTSPTPQTLPTPPTLPNSPTLPPQPSACHSYISLSDSWRRIDYSNRGSFPVHCDKTGRARWTTYTSLDAAWYRFTGAAGTKLPTAPAPVGGGPSFRNQICGSMANAYILSGGNPTIQEGIVTRDVCFELGRISCWWNTTVKAAACNGVHGDYFVYELQPVADCNFAYCALD